VTVATCDNSSSSSGIVAVLDLQNDTGQALDLTKVEISYFYSDEAGGTHVMSVDYYSSAAAPMAGFYNYSGASDDSEMIMTFPFGSLADGGKAAIHFRIHRGDFLGTWTYANDWSNPTKGCGAPQLTEANDHIVVRYDGEVVWGTPAP
jgi:hypothetical protein